MLSKQVFLLHFSLFLSIFLSAQTQKELEKMTEMELLIAFSKAESDTLLQKKYANAYLSKAKKAKSNLNIAKGYYLYSLISETNLSIQYLDSVIFYSKKVKDKTFPMVAYFEKGNKLDSKLEFSEAIDNYVLSEKAAIVNKNEDYIYNAKLSIAMIRSEDMGETDDALQLYKDCLKYYQKNKSIDEFHYENYLRTLFCLADAYKTMKIYDSTSYYNYRGYKESIKSANEYFKFLFVLSEGANQGLQGNSKYAIDSIKKSLPYMIKYKDQGNTLASYFYMAKSYEGLQRSKETVSYYTKVDSLYKVNNYITPEFTDGYRYLIDFYKKNGNKEKQIYYINALMTIDSTFNINYKELVRKINKEFDIPNLMKEKETIINTLKDDKNVNFGIIGVLSLVVFGSAFFGFMQVQQKQKYKQLFNDLIKSSVASEKEKTLEKVKTKQLKDSLEISEEIVLDIRRKMKLFEKENFFLNASISIQSLAQNFSTNYNYLSKIINHDFEKSFTNYINDLRIDYIVKELKTNKNLRKYTINGIAEEAGFNNAESFSKAFQKRTGIKPSYFLKELNKL
jgi:AraC-like DNA-binding protein